MWHLFDGIIILFSIQDVSCIIFLTLHVLHNSDFWFHTKLKTAHVSTLGRPSFLLSERPKLSKSIKLLFQIFYLKKNYLFYLCNILAL